LGGGKDIQAMVIDTGLSLSFRYSTLKTNLTVSHHTYTSTYCILI
jgi:hypothetical protein